MNSGFIYKILAFLFFLFFFSEYWLSVQQFYIPVGFKENIAYPFGKVY